MSSTLKLTVISVFLFFVLAFRFFFFYSNQPQYADGQMLNFETTILSQPQISGNRQVVNANLASGKQISIILPLIPEIVYGDRLRLSGNVKVLNGNKTSSQNGRLIMYFPKVEIVKNNHALAVIGIVRQKLVSLFLHSLPNPSSSLLLGIVFGIKESMPKEFTENLRTSGVMHVIAASGMNVTLLGGFMSTFFTFFFNRRIAIGLSMLTICFYAFLAGLGPSIIRASIMGILVFSAQIIGRQNLASYGLILSGFVMLLISPHLLFDIGFQLSFAATAGLLYIRPLFEPNKKAKTIIKKSLVGGEIITTISAQLATLPIILANFGLYSLWSILVNGLVLWTVPILMAIGGVGALAGLVFAPLGSLILYSSYPLLLYFEKTVSIFAKMGGVVNFQNLPWPLIVGYYIILVSLCIRKK